MNRPVRRPSTRVAPLLRSPRRALPRALAPIVASTACLWAPAALAQAIAPTAQAEPAAAAPPGLPPADSATPGPRTVELTTLRIMRQKNMLSEDEYQSAVRDL